jgi:hypothetical protein
VDLLQQRHVVHAVVVVPTIFGQCPLVPNRNEPVEKHVDKTGVGAERIQKPAPSGNALPQSLTEIKI